MDITWIYGAVAIGGIIMTAINGEYYRRKCRKYEKALDEKSQELHDAQRTVKVLHDEVIRYQCHCIRGRLYMRYYDEVLEGKGFIVVHGGCEPDSTHHFNVKVFEYDPNDPEDREFAIREAEELIEIIKKF